MTFYIHSTPELYLVVYKIYDRQGNLKELIDVYVPKLCTKWRAIREFLKDCTEDEVREVQICKRHTFAIVATQGRIFFHAPIRADLRGIV